MISYYCFTIMFRKHSYLYPLEWYDFKSRYPLLWMETDPDIVAHIALRMKWNLEIMKEKLDSAKRHGII